MIDFTKTADILLVDKAVRYVGIIDQTGNIVASKSRGGGGVTLQMMRCSDLTRAS